VTLRDVEFAKRRRKVLDDLDALHAAPHDLAVGDGPDDHLGAPRPQFTGLEPFLVVEGYDLVPPIEQPLDQGLPGESGASRDQNAHGASFCDIYKTQNLPKFTVFFNF
jgi:hypothetical protein